MYESVHCVHIGNLAAISGVTRFMTPYTDAFRFSKEENISMLQFANLEDPCHLKLEMLDRLCAHNASEKEIEKGETEKWKDDIYDEEYFDRRDDFLRDEGEKEKENETVL